MTIIERLSQMLDSVACAIIILTAEEEQVDGSIQARMNVIHEVGLFQGRLGFSKTIVLIEDGCLVRHLGLIQEPLSSVYR